MITRRLAVMEWRTYIPKGLQKYLAYLIHFLGRPLSVLIAAVPDWTVKSLAKLKRCWVCGI